MPEKVEEHSFLLIWRRVADVLLKVDSTGAYQGGVQPVHVVCRHEDDPLFAGSHAIQHIQQAAKGYIVGSFALLPVGEYGICIFKQHDRPRRGAGH